MAFTLPTLHLPKRPTLQTGMIRAPPPSSPGSINSETFPGEPPRTSSIGCIGPQAFPRVAKAHWASSGVGHSLPRRSTYVLIAHSPAAPRSRDQRGSRTWNPGIAFRRPSSSSSSCRLTATICCRTDTPCGRTPCGGCLCRRDRRPQRSLTHGRAPRPRRTSPIGMA